MSRRVRLKVLLVPFALVVSLLVGMPAAHAISLIPPCAGNADFNHDGYADLAVGQPDVTVGGHAKAGSITIMYGGPKGLKTGGQVLSQNTPGVAGAAQNGDKFGYVLMPGDFNF